MSQETLDKLAKEGADPRLSVSEARFNAGMARCLGVPVHPLTDESVEFIHKMDHACRQILRDVEKDEPEQP